MLSLLFFQSTYCDQLQQHCETIRRSIHVINLGEAQLAPRERARIGPSTRLRSSTFPGRPADPAAERFNYPVSFDIRDLITLQDVMEELELGPNGYVALHMGAMARPWIALRR
jgi:GPN-loop GTPase